MSARALCGRYAGIPDEMESFFHVTLWHAVKYLPHNCEDLDSFMSDFFDGVRFYNGRSLCGLTKLMAMKEGIITLYNSIETSDSQLVFRKTPEETHPMMGFIETSLTLFKDYYLATAQSGSIKSHHLGISDVAQVSSPSHPIAKQVIGANTLSKPTSAATSPSPQQPTHLLHDHEAVKKTFSYWLGQEWPDDDKTSDQLQPNYDPSKAQKYQDKISTRLDSAAGSSSKRKKADNASQVSSPSSGEPSTVNPPGSRKARRKAAKKARSHMQNEEL